MKLRSVRELLGHRSRGQTLKAMSGNEDGHQTRPSCVAPLLPGGHWSSFTRLRVDAMHIQVIQERGEASNCARPVEGGQARSGFRT